MNIPTFTYAPILHLKFILKKKKERKHKLSVTDSEKTKQDNRIESHREMCAAVTLDRMTWEGFLEGMSF